MIRQYELVERVRSYDPATNEDALNRAYVYAMKVHGSQRRASGDPYFSHPLEVAGILTDMRLDHSTIITALLHDTIEDTEATLQDLRRLFGDDIASLVDGVTKLTRIELQSDRTKQAENFRKLVLAMSRDIRVLLVKLADRLHNMRTLHHISDPEKRRRIASETMEIYAPLAERIGIQSMRDELEDRAFAELHPDVFESIVTRRDYLTAHDGGLVDRIIEELEQTCAEAGMKASVSGRRKSPYSIWLKMQRKDVGIEQVTDIMAFRLVVPSEGDCYQALGAVHGAYPLIPGRFKDYISTPKPNGYRSLHTGVIGPYRQRIEIQIRTAEMHEIAELGVAAHWIYKQTGGPAATHEGKQYRWLRELLDILETASGPEEFLEHTKLEMYQDLVFCFSPKGDLISLPRGATPVDFAYAVHSEVGDRCVGAKINGRLSPLSTALNNGDQIDIMTSKTSTPSPTWDQFVVTGKAKARIRRFVRLQRREQFGDLGRAILQKTFRQEGQTYSEAVLKPVLGHFNYETVEDLMAAVGEGALSAREVLHAAVPQTKVASKSENVVPIARARDRKKSGHAIPIKGLIPGMAVHYARCCHPLPGERIVGIVTTGKGVTIHTIDCETLENFQSMPERWLDVSWDPDGTDSGHAGRLSVVLANEPGSLGSLSTVIGKHGGNIINLKIVNRSVDFFEMLVDIEVGDVRHLTNIIGALRATPVINSVDRARN